MTKCSVENRNDALNREVYTRKAHFLFGKLEWSGLRGDSGSIISTPQSRSIPIASHFRSLPAPQFSSSGLSIIATCSDVGGSTAGVQLLITLFYEAKLFLILDHLRFPVHIWNTFKILTLYFEPGDDRQRSSLRYSANTTEGCCQSHRNILKLNLIRWR